MFTTPCLHSGASISLHSRKNFSKPKCAIVVLLLGVTQPIALVKRRALPAKQRYKSLTRMNRYNPSTGSAGKTVNGKEIQTVYDIYSNPAL
jgi:hypothetical protein